MENGKLKMSLSLREFRPRCDEDAAQSAEFNGASAPFLNSPFSILNYFTVLQECYAPANVLFHFSDRKLPIMKQTGCQCGIAAGFSNTSEKCSSEPQPPDAMTGMPTTSTTALVSFRSKAGLGAVLVHRGQQDPRPRRARKPLSPTRPRPCRSGCARCNVNLKAGRHFGVCTRVDGNDHALAAVLSPQRHSPDRDS